MAGDTIVSEGAFGVADIESGKPVTIPRHLRLRDVTHAEP